MSLISASLRETVVRRAGNRCEYCRLSQEGQVATFPVDHIKPTSGGGLTVFDNLALACPRCNALKWKHVDAPDPETGENVTLFNPRVHRWSDHFRWSATNPTLVEPLSEIGRATLLLLEMNAAPHQTIRGLLGVLGLHPPPEQT